MASLPLEKTIELLQAFCDLLKNSELQDKVVALQKRQGVAKQLGISQVMGLAASKAAASLRFGDEWTVQQVIEVAKCYENDLCVRLRAREVEAALKMDEGVLFGLTKDGDPPQQNSDPAPAEDVLSDRHQTSSEPVLGQAIVSDEASESLASRLLDAFTDACEMPEIQTKLVALQKKAGIAKRLGISQLTTQASTQAGAKVGLGDGFTIKQLQDTVKEHGSSKAIRSKARKAENVWGMDVGSLFGMTEESDPREIDVVDQAVPPSNDDSSSALQTSKEPEKQPAPQGLPVARGPVVESTTQEIADVKTVVQLSTSDVGVLKLLEALIGACEEDGFREKWEAVRKRSGIPKQLATTQLLGQVSKQIGASCGFGDEFTTKQLQEIVKESGDQFDIRVQARKVEAIFDMPEAALFGLKKEDDPLDSKSGVEPAHNWTQKGRHWIRSQEGTNEPLPTSHSITDTEDHQSKIDSLEQKLNTKENENTDLEAKVTDLESRLAAALQAVATSAEDKKALQQRLDGAEEQVRLLNATIADLRTAKDSAEEQVQLLNATILDLRTAKEPVASDLADSIETIVKTEAEQEHVVIPRGDAHVDEKVAENNQPDLDLPPAAKAQPDSELLTSSSAQDLVDSPEHIDDKINEKGKESNEADSDKMSASNAKALLQQILRLVSESSFKADVEQRYRNHIDKRTPVMQWRGGLGAVFWEKVKYTVHKFGFREASDYFDALWQHQKDSTVKSLVHDIEKTLCVPIGSFFGILDSNWQRPNLSQARALEILRDVKGVCESKPFQRGLDAPGVNTEVAVRGAVIPIALAYGFGGGPTAFDHVSEALSEVDASEELKKLVQDIERLARVPRGTLSLAAKEEVQKIKLTVKHAVNNNAIEVSVPSTATMSDIKAAAADLLGSPAVVSNGRLVRKQGGGFSSYKDDERVGDKRSMLFLGTDLVSKSAGGKQPTAESSSVSITLSQAISLQKELKEAFSKMDFQQKRLQLEAQHPNGAKDPKFRFARSQLFMTVQGKILPKYGFEEGPKGVQEMMGVLMQYNDKDEEFDELGRELNFLLGLHDLNPPGWKPKGKPAMDDGSGSAVMSVEQAVALQKDLRKGFMDLEFQKKRLQLEQRHSDKAAIGFLRERQGLFLTVQSEVLPKYGFPGTPAGLSKMLRAFGPVNDDPLVSQHALELNYLLGLENAPGQGIPGWSPPQFIEDAVSVAATALGESQSTMVTLEVKHGISGTKVELQMMVSKTTSLKDVRVALSEKLGRADVVESGKFVKKGGGGFASLKDIEPLGEKRSLLLLGVEL